MGAWRDPPDLGHLHLLSGHHSTPDPLTPNLHLAHLEGDLEVFDDGPRTYILDGGGDGDDIAILKGGRG